jgi:hypothetical protein
MKIISSSQDRRYLCITDDTEGMEMYDISRILAASNIGPSIILHSYENGISNLLFKYDCGSYFIIRDECYFLPPEIPRNELLAIEFDDVTFNARMKDLQCAKNSCTIHKKYLNHIRYGKPQMYHGNMYLETPTGSIGNIVFHHREKDPTPDEIRDMKCDFIKDRNIFNDSSDEDDDEYFYLCSETESYGGIKLLLYFAYIS